MTRGRPLRALVLIFGLVAATFALVAPVRTQGPDNSRGLQIGLHKGHQVAAGEVLVKLREDARFAQMPQEFDVDRDELVGDASIRRIHSRSHDVDTLLAKLAEFEDVEYAEPNYIVYALATPNDPSFASLWGMLKIAAPTAWDRTTGLASNVVGVVDTGIDYTHPDLAANVWTAPSDFNVTIGGVTKTCSAGTHGFNAITKTCDPMDDEGHGTHVSGTIGAVGNNGVGVAGVNWTTSIMGLKFLDNKGSGTTADAINAIEFAIQAANVAGADVRVLSNSWGGGGYSQSLYNEIDKANKAHMLFVAAAGNSGTNNDTAPFYPASYTAANVVAVAATGSSDQLASWSNYGVSTVDLGAPGVNILSTYLGNQYAYMSGTSMATPHVAGAAALVLAVCDTLDAPSLKDVLLDNAEPLASLVGKTVTGGRLNVSNAISHCGTAPPQPADFSISASPTSRTVARGQSTTYNASVASINGFTGSVDLSAGGLPAGATATFNPAAATTSSPATLTVKTASGTKTKAYTLTITGTSGSVTHSTTVTLKVTR